jgi:hypothetical protein
MKFEWDERKNRRNKKKLAKNTEEFDRRFDGGEEPVHGRWGIIRPLKGPKLDLPGQPGEQYRLFYSFKQYLGRPLSAVFLAGLNFRLWIRDDRYCC